MVNQDPENALWDVDEESGEEVKRAVQYLNKQQLRTTSAESAANEAAIKELWNVSELSKGVEGIEYIDEASFTTDQFSEAYIAAGRPCMIRGSCKGWKAETRWETASEIKRWHGDMPIRITEIKEHASAMARPLRIPLRHYLAYAESNSGDADFPWYGFDDDFGDERAELLSDWEVPLYFRDDCYDISHEARHVFPRNRFFIVGGTRSGTGLHVDPNSTCAWNTLLCGRKRWVLFPPGKESSYLEMLGVQEEYSRKVSQPCKWWREVYPRLLALARHGATGAGGEPLRIIDCVQEQGETIFVPAGWWHAVLNLNVTIAITANHLPPASLPCVLDDLRESWPKDFLSNFLQQCAAKWPQYVRDLATSMHDSCTNSPSESSSRQNKSQENENHGDVASLPVQLEALVRQLPGGFTPGVLFLDADGVLKSPDGSLRASSVLVLQQLIVATKAELVLTSASRAAEVSRQALRQSLNRWGLDFSRWITTGELPGGRSGQILDFVTRNKIQVMWAVVDSEGVGDMQGGLVMMQLLHSRCVVVDREEGLGGVGAVDAAKILLELDDDDDDEEGE